VEDWEVVRRKEGGEEGKKEVVRGLCFIDNHKRYAEFASKPEYPLQPSCLFSPVNCNCSYCVGCDNGDMPRTAFVGPDGTRRDVGGRHEGRTFARPSGDCDSLVMLEIFSGNDDLIVKVLISPRSCSSRKKKKKGCGGSKVQRALSRG